ncbi:cardiolipin synthase ClsB [Pseudomonas sp. SDO528_S397]
MSVTLEHIATDQPPPQVAPQDQDYAWQSGNQVQLLENGEAYFPRVFDALRQARHEILLETFILFEDKVGHALKTLLVEAAQRGVKVIASLDGFGSGELTPAFLGELVDAGVTVQMFDPAGKTLGFRTNWFRRLHRKIVVVDATVAFIGGINFSADHLGDYGPEAKQDYAVQVTGPAVADLHHFALAQSGRRVRKRRGGRRGQRTDHWTSSDAEGQVRLIYRDNVHHRTDIEEAYIEALNKARQRVIIANAYFFPGYRLLRAIRNAARRGVQVQLIMQGQPDVWLATLAARMLYDYLLKDGVVIHEYCDRPLHGKVALVDEHWSTVGSSNLDPLSLSLNLEANVLVHDRAFNQQLYERLQDLSAHHCRTRPENRTPRLWLWRLTVGFLVFHVLRHVPVWTGWLPAHKPRLTPFAPAQDTAHDHPPHG